MGFFKRAFYGIGMILTGKVLDRIDTQMMGGRGQMSLRLKQKDDASEAYVVIGLWSKYSLYPLTATEFNDFADAVQTIRGGLPKTNERLTISER
jgi:hypothetical protein